MATAFDRAVSFSTLSTSADLKSSPNRVFPTLGKLSCTYLVHAGSMDSRILERRSCEMSSDALPIRQRVLWQIVSTSPAGTDMSVSSMMPLSINPCQADTTGHAMAKTANCTLFSLAS